MEKINIFLSFTCYSFPTSCVNILTFSRTTFTDIFRQNIVFVYVTLIMITSKILVISPNYVDCLVEPLCLCILYAFNSAGSTSRCFWTTSRHVVWSFYHGNGPIFRNFSVLCFCSALFHPAAGQPTLVSGWVKTRAPGAGA